MAQTRIPKAQLDSTLVDTTSSQSVSGKNLSSGNTFPTFNQNTTGSAATLTTARTIQTNLASTSSASFNGSANITPGVTGTLAVGNGGTGVTTSTGSGSNVLSTSPTLTTPVISSIVNTGTLTLPTSTDTLVGRATTDTLTTKTIGDSLKFVGQTSVPATPSTGQGVIYAVGSSTSRPHYMNSSGSDEVILTNADGQVPGNALSTSAITLGYAQITSPFSTSSTSSVAVTGLSVTVTVPTGGRRIKLTYQANGQGITATTGYTTVEIWQGSVGSGTRLNAFTSYTSVGGGQQISSGIATVTPSAGTQTFSVGFYTTAGTGQIYCVATAPAFLLVEAI